LVGLILGLLFAPGALASSPLTSGQEDTATCQALAPHQTWCDLGTHAAWRYWALVINVARDYTGTIGFVIAHPLGHYQEMCDVRNGLPISDCTSEGLRPVMGEPFRVSCLSLALRTEDPGGVGSWRCNFNSV
jgi:hypothetical protein